MFYEFRQNNSGGSLVDNLLAVIVEADSAAEANSIAEDRTPVYFNGCDEGMDCPCCGDRWYECWENDGTELPAQYSETDQSKWNPGIWEAGSVTVDIYYKDGRIESVKPTAK